MKEVIEIIHDEVVELLNDDHNAITLKTSNVLNKIHGLCAGALAVKSEIVEEINE